MIKQPIIHIFHISNFGGHSQAALNIKEAILAKNSSAEIVNLNSFQYFYPRTEKVIDTIYKLVIKRIPSLWGKAYDHKAVAKYLRPWHTVINYICFPKLRKYIKAKKPNCFITTQAFPCGIIADYKKKHKPGIPLIAVVTDFHPHRFWMHPYVDQYIVASGEAKTTLIKEGVAEDKIAVFGIPISIKFMNNSLDKRFMQKLGFSSQLKSILVMGGGLGMGPIEKIVTNLDHLDHNFQVIVVCGKNRTLYRKLQKIKNKIKKPLFIFSYIEYINKIMDFSDIIITKAGGITVSEALVKKMAIIITNPIPGQEELNVNFLLKRNAIIKADTLKQINESVANLIENPDRLKFLKENAKKNSLEDSSAKIANLIFKFIN
ncbi:MAG: glycosyltransferase [Candidatus Omnitrophica bacterium]|nr:glycosyltransferase [Candidatus Omnitrophota bacterium]MCF7894555.1 glycosyltransferase [Candidatus Omnitrophota bacterium]